MSRRNRDLTQEGEAPAESLETSDTESAEGAEVKAAALTPEEEAEQVEAFKTDCEEAMVVAEQDYYNGRPPRPLPAVPEKVDESGNLSGEFLIPTKKVPFRYQKVTLPNGKTYLAIVLLDVELPR